jgi:hypothetical protein
VTKKLFWIDFAGWKIEGEDSRAAERKAVEYLMSGKFPEIVSVENAEAEEGEEEYIEYTQVDVVGGAK